LAILGVMGFIGGAIHVFIGDKAQVSGNVISLLFKAFQIYLFSTAFLGTHRKDLKKAQRAVTLFKWYMGLLAIIDIAFLIIYHHNEFEFIGPAEDMDIKPEDFHGLMILILATILFIEEALTGLLLYGAIKIRNTLRQTHELLNENNYVYQP